MIGLELAEQYDRASDAVKSYLVAKLPELTGVDGALMDSLASEYMRCILLDPSCYYSAEGKMRILKEAETKYRRMV